MNRTNARERRRAIAETAATQTRQQIAAHFGVSVSHVTIACREHGVAPVRQLCSRIRDRWKAMAKAVKCGQTCKNVAAQFGVSRNTVYHACKVHGVESSVQQSSIFRREVIKLRMRGMCASDIAKKLGLSSERICQFLRPLGLSQVSVEEEYGVDVQELVSQGFNHAAICERLGLSSRQVSRYIKPEPVNHDKRCAEQFLGKRFGTLVVRRVLPRDERRARLVEVVCDCGTVKTVHLGNLKSGMTRSCGRKGSSCRPYDHDSLQARRLRERRGYESSVACSASDS